MNHHHERVVCLDCGEVIRQCRCMAEKLTAHERCDKCEAKRRASAPQLPASLAATPPPESRSAAEALAVREAIKRAERDSYACPDVSFYECIEYQMKKLVEDARAHSQGMTWSEEMRPLILESLAAAHLAGQIAMRERCAEAVGRRLRERFGLDGDRYAQSAAVAIAALKPEPMK